MKLRYPAEAFALGIILFSAGMKEAFAAGILVILTAVFAEFLKDLLENAVPTWSLTLCVLIASGVFCASACQIGFAYLGLSLSVGTWLMSLIVGLLCARHALSGNIENEKGELFFESAVAWGFWILLAIIREFMGSGTIFGNPVFQNPIQSKIFLESTFAFLTAGLVLAFTNGFLKKNCRGFNSLLVVIPTAVFIRPFTISSFTGFAEYLGIAWTIIVPILLFLSVKQTLKFSQPGKAYRGLPTDLIAAGFIYMILSIY